MTTVVRTRKAAKNLFFMFGYFAVITFNGADYFTNISHERPIL